MKRYVIGDIHGCYEQLSTLLGIILQDVERDKEWKIIFVGDYFDRGPHCKDVWLEVRHLQACFGDKIVTLMGNHEDMLLHGEMLYARETLASFDGFIPEEVSVWMQKLPKYYEDDTIIVAHAGADPGVPMDCQKDAMLMWYRYQVMQKAHMVKHFYHGHTPFLGMPERCEDRTNVDTGCVFGGSLTAAVVGEDGNPVRFIQVENSM